jgi:sec-independent protein translocase protein TatC
MTLSEHLAELRTRLIVSAIAFLAASIAAFAFFGPILQFLVKPLCSVDPKYLGPQGCHPIYLSALEPFSIRLKVSALVAVVASSPVWLYELWAFITPGLTQKERRYAGPFVITSIALFSLGAAFGYITLPKGLAFLFSLGAGEIVAFINAQQYINFVGLLLLGFGVTFELPLVLLFLGLAGLIEVQQLKRQRRLAIVSIALLAAIVTPSQDPYTMLAMAVPLWVFYEVTILVLSAVSKRRAARNGI